MAKKRSGNGRGSVYQRGDGKWCAAVTLPDGRRKVVYGRTSDEVDKKLTALKSDRDKGLPVAVDRQTMAQYLQAWLRDVAEPRVKPITYQGYEALLTRHVVPALGKRQLTKLSPQDIAALYK